MSTPRPPQVTRGPKRTTDADRGPPEPGSVWPRPRSRSPPASVLLVVALARELGVGRRGALIAGALFALSPVVIVQSGTYLPYLGNLAFLLAFAVAVRRGARTGSAALVAAAGFALGLAFW